MTRTCPMCGHRFEATPQTSSEGQGVCPACGTPIDDPQPGRLTTATREAVLRKVQPPAICLVVVGALMVAGGCLGGTVLALQQAGHLPQNGVPGDGAVPPEREAGRVVGQIAGAVIAPIFGIAVILGGIKMYRLESWGSVMTASILAALPCSFCCLLGVPVSIWSLIVLNDPEVKTAFH